MSITFERFMATGIREIDDQHRDIIQYLSHMLDRLADSEEPLRAETLATLANTLQRHFQSEEQVMDRVHYPDYGYHKAQHEEFMKYFNSLSDASHQEFGESGRTHAHYFLHWLINHIMESDRKMADFLCRSKRRPLPGEVMACATH